jgi:hypothetical protein
MKRIRLLLLTLVLAGVCVFGLSQRANDTRRELGALQDGLVHNLQRLEAIQTQKAALEIKIHDLGAAMSRSEPAVPVDMVVSEIIRTNGLACMPTEMWCAFLAGLGFTWQSSDSYVLVHKAALKGVRPNLFKLGGKGAEVADLACAVLSILPEERQQVDAAFANSWGEFAALARTNIQRDGPSGQMLVRFTIPGSEQIAQILTNHLFSNASGAIGSERAELLGPFASGWGWSAPFFAGVTNTLAVLQQPVTGGTSGLLCQRSGRSEVTTQIDPQHFPPPWEKIFPGGWTEIARREGLELPQSKQ